MLRNIGIVSGVFKKNMRKMLSAFIIVLNCVKNRWESMGDLSIRCGIFQVDNLLPLLFVL